jgi:biotin operon repressor
MRQIKKFTNSRFVVLEHLYNNKDGENIARLTQGEIAVNLDMGRVTINKLISELSEDGYLQDATHAWGYILTSKAIVLITAIKNADKKLSNIEDKK